MATLADVARRYAETIWDDASKELSLAQRIALKPRVIAILSTAFTRGFEEGVNYGKR